MPTMRQIRQAMLAMGGLGGVFSASGGTTTTITTTDYRFAGTTADTDRMKGWAVLRPDAAAAGDLERYVDSVSVGAGVATLTVSPAYQNAPQSDEDIEYVRLPLEPALEQLFLAVNLGLARCWFPARYQIPLVSGQREYDLSGVPGLEPPLSRRIRHLEYRTGSDATQYRRRDESAGGPVFDVIQDGTTWTLVIDPPLRAAADEALFLEYNRRFPALPDDATSSDIDLTLAAYAGLAEYYGLLAAAYPGDYREQVQFWEGRFALRNRQHKPEPVVRLHQAPPVTLPWRYR